MLSDQAAQISGSETQLYEPNNGDKHSSRNSGKQLQIDYSTSVANQSSGAMSSQNTSNTDCSNERSPDSRIRDGLRR